jgi:hypothetical protein
VIYQFEWHGIIKPAVRRWVMDRTTCASWARRFQDGTIAAEITRREELVRGHVHRVTLSYDARYRTGPDADWVRLLGWATAGAAQMRVDHYLGQDWVLEEELDLGDTLDLGRR